MSSRARLRRGAPAQTDAESVGISARQGPAFRRRLLAWFDKNKREMPWRQRAGAGGAPSPPNKKDPYRVWLSEIMLQQTRVTAVVPYYERFLSKFPTVRELARARAAAVLGAWAGLGYYSRARNLQRAAREIVSTHDGEFPREYDAALQLPGIGRYTAAAILSIAYRQPLAALDGNVARVLARLGAVHGDIRRSKLWRQLDAAAGALLAREAPGDWNEAMMELGATVCTPIAPRCEQCPVARWCRARAQGIAERLPEARLKTAPVEMTIAAAVLLDPRGRTLLVRQTNGDGALFARLWQFPAVEAGGDPRKALRDHLRSVMRRTVDAGEPGARALKREMKPLAPARHAVTFRDIRLLPFLVRVPRLPSLEGARTPRLASLDRLAISSATRKIARAALEAT